jgi:aminopeptidase YwaD
MRPLSRWWILLPCAAAAALAAPAPAATPAEALGVDAHRVAAQVASRIGPRPSASAAEGRALDLAAARFQAAGLSVVRDPFDVPRRGRSSNVIGRYGSSARCLKILVAHADSVTIAPGANDNGSGLGLVVALADRLAGLRPRCGIWLVATGSEERGVTGTLSHLGAAQLVAHVRRHGIASRVRYVLSLDDLGFGRRFWLRSPQRRPRRAVEGQLLRIARRARVRVVWARDDGLGNSDHREPELAGIPGMVLESWRGEDGCRHRPCDTADRLEPEAFALVARVAEGVIRTG